MTRLLAAEGAKAAVAEGDVTLVWLIAGIALVALVVAYVFSREVLAAGKGTARMQEISRAVQEGANAYLSRQFRTLAVFVVIVFFVLLLLPADSTGVRIGRSTYFVLGAVFSALVGLIGMTLATRANVRVAAAAQEKGESAALRIAFRAGGVVGMTTVGLGLLGASTVLLIFDADAPAVLEGFGFGGALLAMFMRVGGGIFTKAADVGADLVGKVEAGIPEDDPRNPATIADNVGDNVGDCAGMAADLFESYAVTLVAALILGQAAFGSQGLVFPLIVPAIGVVTAIAGILLVTPRPGDASGMAAINRGFFLSAIISAILVSVASWLYLPDTFDQIEGASRAVQAVDGNPRLFAVGAVIIGLVLAAVIQILTGYFTETNRKPVTEVADASRTGPATVILAGISLGLESAVYSALVIAGAVYAAYLLGGSVIALSLFAVALAGTGLLTTVGVIVSMDTFGPISDNAQGVAEMSGDVDEKGAATLTSLDAVGNTTKAITKGIAIATAVLAATALFGSFKEAVSTALVDAGEKASDFSLSVDQPQNLVGLIIGASIVFLFSALAIRAVSRAAGRVVFEVRDQFRRTPAIMDYKPGENTGVRPDYQRVVDICTRDSLRELATPGLLAILAPVATGFLLGYSVLGSYLAGVIASGVLMAVFLANSGGAWDNAKKWVEDGHYGGKRSDAHSATVIGDTVGDPFKDTAGPAINPLMKVMNLVALLIAPSVVNAEFGDMSAAVRYGIGGLALLVVVGAVVFSKRSGSALGQDEEQKSASVGS